MKKGLPVSFNFVQYQNVKLKPNPKLKKNQYRNDLAATYIIAPKNIFLNNFFFTFTH
jgi:hypothetical protein